MTATTGFRTRRLAVHEAPPSVRWATTILYVLIFLGLLSPLAFLGVTAASMVRGNAFDRELTLVAVLSFVTVVIGWFYLMLTRKARKGRRWAWLTLLMMLALVAFIGAVVMTSVANGAATGFVMTIVPLFLIALLAGPRRARAYYRYRSFTE